MIIIQISCRPTSLWTSTKPHEQQSSSWVPIVGPANSPLSILGTLLGTFHKWLSDKAVGQVTGHTNPVLIPYCPYQMRHLLWECQEHPGTRMRQARSMALRRNASLSFSGPGASKVLERAWSWEKELINVRSSGPWSSATRGCGLSSVGNMWGWQGLWHSQTRT